MNHANDDAPSYVQAVLVLIYDQHEEYREVFASDLDAIKLLAERVYHDTPKLQALTLWFEDARQAWVYNGPRQK